VQATRKLTHPKFNTLGRYILTDLVDNLTIVTLPAAFTNTAWRFLNLYRIGVANSVSEDIMYTTMEVATTVFAICFLIDMIRQLFAAHRVSVARSRLKRSRTSSGACSLYLKHKGLRKSARLAFKFFCGVVGWTAGYESVATEHQIDASTKTGTVDKFAIHAAAAGLGSSIALWLACETVEWLQVVRGSKKTKAVNHRGAFGVAFKGFLEGACWSVLGDMNIYRYMDHQHIAESVPLLRKMVDGLTVGIAASLCFSLAGLVSSYFGYRRLLAKYQK
jgi:hypothetical protein